MLKPKCKENERYVDSTNQCIKKGHVIDKKKCKDNEKYNPYMQKCVDKNNRRKCHEGYRYDESKKICVKSSCPPGQVYRKKYGCVPKCKDNEKYNPSLKKSEPKTKSVQMNIDLIIHKTDVFLKNKLKNL